MIRDIIFPTVGGLGLFMFGMSLMSEGLKKVAGQRLRGILESMTSKPLTAFLIGAGVTALVQSSSATTVMVIGFVNAGLLTLRQAICVVIGTNVGTTTTAWLVSLSGLELFRITAYALPAVALGFVLQLFGRTRTAKSIGKILLGFGILFIGIGFMKDAFAGLQKSPAVQNLFLKAGDNPLLAIFAGTIVTILIHSSSAALASVQLLAVAGAFGRNWQIALYISIPFILGCNIGTTVTAQLAALRANIDARRTAWAHTIFNIVGAFICLWFIDAFAKLVYIIIPWRLGPTTIAAGIAVAHTTFNVLNSALFLPLSKLLENVVVLLIKETPGDAEARPVVLERRLLETPVIALAQAKREIIRMAKRAKDAVNQAVDGFRNTDRTKLEAARKSEDMLDTFQFEITSYLTALARKHLSEQVAVKLPVLLHTVNDLERVGDHAVNIVEIAERKIEQKLTLSDSAQQEAAQLTDQVNQMCDRVSAALETGSIDQARAALLNENNLNRMQIDFRRTHVQRMADGLSSAAWGLIFIDLVDNMEKIGDHLTNIAQAVIGGLQWADVEPAS